MLPKIKLVIFDLDGTLINAYPAICQSFNYVMKELGLPRRNHSVIIKAVGWGERQLLAPFLKPQHIEAALKLYRIHHIKALRGVKFFPGAKRLLETLKGKGYKLAVATNRPRKTSLIILDQLKVRKYFDRIVCGDKIKKPKPHPAMLNQILKQLSLRPSEATYVGDMMLDMQAGRRAKMKTIAVVTGSSSKREIIKERPFKVVSNIFEVSKILNQLN